ncbi:MAG: hypothetical protein ACRYFU_23115 [Janthinobacterium lividum]
MAIGRDEQADRTAKDRGLHGGCPEDPDKQPEKDAYSQGRTAVASAGVSFRKRKRDAWER